MLQIYSPARICASDRLWSRTNSRQFPHDGPLHAIALNIRSEGKAWLDCRHSLSNSVCITGLRPSYAGFMTSLVLSQSQH